MFKDRAWFKFKDTELLNAFIWVNKYKMHNSFKECKSQLISLYFNWQGHEHLTQNAGIGKGIPGVQEKFKTAKSVSPIYSKYYLKLYAIDVAHANQYFPIKQAVLKAVEIVLFYHSFTVIWLDILLYVWICNYIWSMTNEVVSCGLLAKIEFFTDILASSSCFGIVVQSEH